jgi:HD-like signal output (HDOD) protein
VATVIDLPVAATTPRILFVDDDQFVLDGLRDVLHPQRGRWSMTFVTDGEAALAELRSHPYDVIVCDLRMPGMDGAQLLDEVRRQSPTAVRIVLSGHAEMGLVARAAGIAHQLLAKPCDGGQLVEVIDRSCTIKRTIDHVERHRSTIGAAVLPSVPHLYVQLADALASGEATVDDVTRIVEQDMGMAAKLLQLANSAYFGRRQPVTAIKGAVIYLGLDALQALVLQAGTFSQFPAERLVAYFNLERLQRHSNRVGHLAREILGGVAHGRDAFTAGLLHDAGQLILASQEPETLERILERAHEQQRPLQEVEREVCEVTHDELGAHLLALWGLPVSVTAAVASHHQPPRPGADLDEVTATYVANVLIEEVEAVEPGSLPPSELDPDYAASLDPELLTRWRGLAAALIDPAR